MVIHNDMEGFQADPRRLITDVYGYPDPEVRELISTRKFDESLLLGVTPVEEARQRLHDGGYTHAAALELPEDGLKSLDLHRIHEPVIDKITRRNEKLLPGLSGFTEQYANQGSAQSIYRLMADWFATGKMKELAIIEGEYAGYLWDATCLGIPITVVPSLAEAGEPVEGRIFFISNPSAVDGNWHDALQWQKFISSHQAIVDAAFIGTTADTRTLDVSSDNIRAVVTSPSKMFGVFYHRYPGIIYTREVVNSLFDTTEFKDIPGLLASLMLYETFGPTELPAKLKEKQQAICTSLSSLLSAVIDPSDSVLIANTVHQLPSQFDDFRRAGRYRLGLKNQYPLLEPL